MRKLWRTPPALLSCPQKRPDLLKNYLCRWEINDAKSAPFSRYSGMRLKVLISLVNLWTSGSWSFGGLGTNAILYFSVSGDDDFWMMFLHDFELTRGRLRDIIPKIIDGLQLIDVCWFCRLLAEFYLRERRTLCPRTWRQRLIPCF